MCGIAGLINQKNLQPSKAVLKKMTDAIAHRGPDGEGFWFQKGVGLGHRRLAILDLSKAGCQPMQSSDRRWVLSYNGEVYNYRELRANLEAEGVQFRSQTDTEVVLYALATWGTAALLKFNGMFALALWDCKKQNLLLARDRYGIKPLYYAMQNNNFSFGSEQKAITAQPGFRKVLNKPALLEYFTFQNIFTDQTLLKDIKMLPAGHYLCLSARSQELRIMQYWDYRFCDPAKPLKKEEYIEELNRLLKRAVTRQLVSDVELGAYLSGGVDSGSIIALATKKIPYLKTFTCGFDLSTASGIELCFDERVKAEAISAKFRTEHYEMVLKAGDMERCLPKLAWHLEEPRVGQSYPNYYIAKLAGKFVKVVLSGTGGDELFGGYPWRYYRAAEAKNFEEYIDHYYLYWQRLVDNHQLKALFKPVFGEVQHVWTRDIFRDVFAAHDNELSRPEDYINHSLYFEAKTFLHGLFMVEDKLSMAHGLETRVPFMDNDLVKFAMNCPVRLKLNKFSNVMRINENSPNKKASLHFQKTRDGKTILRKAIEKYIPKETVEAKKQGFSSPDASWFRSESLTLLKSFLTNKDAKIFNYLDRKSVTQLVTQHLEGKENRRLLIWSFLYIEKWLNNTL